MAPGTLVANKYLLRRLVGEGAMGQVWAAQNRATEREVALKLIPRSTGFTKELRERMLREARAAGRIAHRNVVEVYDAGETAEGDPFLVMALLSGETLAARIEREGRLSAETSTRIATEIARGLVAAHNAGIVHRDLKPGNVFLHREPDDEEATTKILDFGVSKIVSGGDSTATATGSAIGSPAYMSPEQARGDKMIDHRSDLWSLGVVIFEMLTGARPFEGETPYAVVGEILHGRIPRPSERVGGIPKELDDLVARCLVRNPHERVTSATEVLSLLRGEGRPALASKPHVSVPYPAVVAAPGVTSTTPMLRGGQPLKGSRQVSRGLSFVVVAGVLAATVLVIGLPLLLRDAPRTPVPAAASSTEAPVQPVVPLPSGTNAAPQVSSGPADPQSGAAPPAVNADAGTAQPSTRPPSPAPRRWAPPAPTGTKKPPAGLPSSPG